MPDNDHTNKEYNPIITGFSYAHGPMSIPLNDAKQRFGRFPSQFGLVSETKSRDRQHRKELKTLNLTAGHFIKTLLEDKKLNLKQVVFDFFNTWHRDFQAEFNVNTTFFFNQNDPETVSTLMKDNHHLLERYSRLDIRQAVIDSG